MTKAAAIHSFWASFGLAAYEESSVPHDAEPDDAAFPYITYELVTDGFGSDAVMTASLWYRSPSWVGANAKAEKIGARIGYGGVLLPCDRGRLWIRRGTPFTQCMGDPADDMIRRVMINIEVMFLTNI